MDINKLEVLRYLGYNNQNIDRNTDNLLNECIFEINTLLEKRFVSDIFDIDKQGDIITLRDTILVLESKDISKHLSKSDKCVLMAASLGLEVDMKIAYYARTNVTKSLILDACASAAIEVLCDEVEDNVRKKACDHGYNITSRFSPGYGDLPITLQKGFIEVLQAYPKMGLTVNESSIMLPRKSVTAIIGWQKEKSTAKISKCKLCRKENCAYRKGGI